MPTWKDPRPRAQQLLARALDTMNENESVSACKRLLEHIRKHDLKVTFQLDSASEEQPANPFADHVQKVVTDPKVREAVSAIGDHLAGAVGDLVSDAFRRRRRRP